MVVNVYVTLPARHPGAGAADYFTGAARGLAWLIPDGPVWAAAHAAFGLALVLAAFAAVALTWRQGRPAATLLSVIGALAIVGAGFNGVSFLDYGHAFSSMIMAGLLALALACYLAAMFVTARRALRGQA
jgi:phosphate/sulfate permease